MFFRTWAGYEIERPQKAKYKAAKYKAAKCKTAKRIAVKYKTAKCKCKKSKITYCQMESVVVRYVSSGRYTVRSLMI